MTKSIRLLKLNNKNLKSKQKQYYIKLQSLPKIKNKIKFVTACATMTPTKCKQIRDQIENEFEDNTSLKFLPNSGRFILINQYLCQKWNLLIEQK